MLSIGSRRRGVLDVSASTCDVYVCGKDRLVRTHSAKATTKSSFALLWNH